MSSGHTENRRRTNTKYRRWGHFTCQCHLFRIYCYHDVHISIVSLCTYIMYVCVYVWVFVLIELSNLNITTSGFVFVIKFDNFNGVINKNSIVTHLVFHELLHQLFCLLYVYPVTPTPLHMMLSFRK